MAKGKYEYWLTPEGLIKLEGWARDGLTDEQIAKNIGISKDTFYRWKNNFQDFSDTLKRGKEVVDRQVENALLKRALGYNSTEITRERIIDTGQNQRHGEAQELTEWEWEIAKAYFGHTCCYCGERTTLTKDHLRPLDKGGILSRDNVVPACRSCNSSKKDHEWLSWYQSKPYYDKKRAQKICDYITFIADISPEASPSSKLVITREVTKPVPPDVTAQIFWLKNRRPDLWRDKRDIELSKPVGDTVKEMEAYFEQQKARDTKSPVE